MRTVLFAAKGGSGVTVTAAALALGTPECLLVDCSGDAALVLGIDEPAIGLLAWLSSPHDVDASSLDRLIVAVRPGLMLLPAGTKQNRCIPTTPATTATLERRFTLLGEYLASRNQLDETGIETKIRTRTEHLPGEMRGKLRDDSRGDIGRGFGEMHWSHIVVDAGTLGISNHQALRALLDQCDQSLMVVRACFLAVHAAIGSDHRVDGLVVVSDEERRITNDDIAAALGHKVMASVAIQPAVARAVDAGLLAARLPRSFTRSLQALVPPQTTHATPGLNRRITTRIPVAS